MNRLKVNRDTLGMTLTARGNNRYANSFGDLGDANLIAAKLWEQAAEVINQPGKEE